MTLSHVVEKESGQIWKFQEANAWLDEGNEGRKDSPFRTFNSNPGSVGRFSPHMTPCHHIWQQPVADDACVGDTDVPNMTPDDSRCSLLVWTETATCF